MPDIFISYKKEEREVASQLATQLTQAGYDVWWDAALFAGSRFEDEIASVLNEAKAVIVLWSRKAAVSDWVKAEAEEARSQKKALPAVIDDVPIENLPLLYRGMHIVQLRNWVGDPGHPGMAELMRSVVAACGPGGPPLDKSRAEARLAETATEAAAWSEAVTSNRLENYRGYLARFGADARFATAARDHISKLEFPVRGDLPRRGLPLPLILASLFAVLLAAGLAGWFVYGRILVDPVPQADRDAASRCTSWSKSGNIDWDTRLPIPTATSLGDCKAAAAAFPKNGDFLAFEAMALSLQAVNHNDEIEKLVDASVALNSGVGMYMQGITRPNTAEKYFKAAADQGYIRAAGRLCVLAEEQGGHLSTDGGDEAAFKAYCKTAAEAGDPFGQVGLGYVLEYGKANESIDENKAKMLYRAAADQGYPLGKVLLGALMVRGHDVLHDFDKAFSLFNEAAEAGQPEGYRWRGIAYEEAIGTHTDIAKASRDYDTASFRLDQVAAMLIGDTPQNGYLNTGLADDEIARQILNTSSVGERLRGAVLWSGYKHVVDLDGAIAAFSSCAGQNALCQFQLGLFYYVGPEKYRDARKARSLLEQGASQGEMRSEFLLAEMIRLGQGGAADPARAQTLYEQSAAQGFYRAQDYLKQQSSTSPRATN